jgi:5'-nucleotidase
MSVLARAGGACLLLALAACAPGAADASHAGRRGITLLHTADLHSHVFPDRLELRGREASLGLGSVGETVSVGGAGRLATVLDDERGRTERSLTLDAGDALEGTAVYGLFAGVPEERVLSALGVDAQALGNHDVAPGVAALKSLRADWATFPLLAANLERERAEGLVVPTAVFARDEVRVAVVGLGRAPDRPPDLGAAVSAVQREVDAVRSDVDVIVVLSHLGTELDLAVVARTVGVDVLLGGHTHDVIAPPRFADDCGGDLPRLRHCRPRRVPVLHSGAYGRYVGKVELVVSNDPADADARDPSRPSTIVDVRAGLLPVGGDVPERRDVAELLEPYRRALTGAGLDRPIAFAVAGVSRGAARGGDSPLGNLVAAAMRQRGEADLAIINTTGIRDDLPAGEVTLSDVFDVLPFEDQLVTLEMPGAALGRALGAVAEASCLRDRQSQIQVDGATLAFGCPRAVDAAIGGRPLDERATYRVATASFLAEPGRWLGAAGAGAPRPAGVGVRGAFAAFLAGAPRCVPPAGPADLPCIDPTRGAAVDGRIQWRRPGASP